VFDIALPEMNEKPARTNLLELEIIMAITGPELATWYRSITSTGLRGRRNPASEIAQLLD
jgi:hypothetical protein